MNQKRTNNLIYFLEQQASNPLHAYAEKGKTSSNPPGHYTCTQRQKRLAKHPVFTLVCDGKKRHCTRATEAMSW